MLGRKRFGPTPPSAVGPPYIPKTGQEGKERLLLMFNQAMQRQNQIAELMSKQAAGVCVLGGVNNQFTD